MSEVEFCWVIRRDDGRFYVTTRRDRNRLRHITDDRLLYALRENSESEAQETIDVYELEGYKPVKIQMRVVEDEKETN